MPRKYEKKGGNGGAREGAGRPVGTGHPNPLEYGEVAALKSLKREPAPEASEGVKRLADEALCTIIEVMRGEAGFSSQDRLRAATLVRHETCGPLVQRMEQSGPDGGPLVVVLDEVKDEPAEGDA